MSLVSRIGARHGSSGYEVLWNDNVEEGFWHDVVYKVKQVFNIQVVVDILDLGWVYLNLAYGLIGVFVWNYRRPF